LCLSPFPWAKFRRTKGAVKLHLLLDHDGYLPTFALISNGSRHDVTYAQKISLATGSIVAMDLKDSTKPEKAVTANFLGQQKLEQITTDDYPDITIEEQVYIDVTDFSEDGYQWYWKTEYVDEDFAF